MTSPKKSVDVERETTFFGQLQKVEVQTKKLSNQLAQELISLKNLTTDFQGIEKEAKHSTQQSKTKLLIEVRMFQQKIKNYLTTQKAEYMRFANQINSMVANSKQINSHLALLGTKFDEFQKNVGL